jgi:hypothetical protein
MANGLAPAGPRQRLKAEVKAADLDVRGSLSWREPLLFRRWSSSFQPWSWAPSWWVVAVLSLFATSSDADDAGP